MWSIESVERFEVFTNEKIQDVVFCSVVPRYYTASQFRKFRLESKTLFNLCLSVLFLKLITQILENRKIS
jgi:hypothetical protein